jgi:acyl transferase domain-containing protein/acyl carrier protein/SAM-dependent methyltransferase
MEGMPPPSRFPHIHHSRSTDKSIFWGNYLRDVSSFDNKFFKKSSREAASMDPQQRLVLEVAYQALESSGYFGPREQDPDVGCFVGVCASDYNDNVASHPPNAYSTLGTLRAFLTGRISHTFGLSGPSVTYDTACSSSAVAIDAACKAVLQGDCRMALAGGVSVFTSPHFFQNLAAASFLSPTGSTKPFDAGADGYCRGEGVGLVVLKPLLQALRDGDNVLGTILATSVRQSSNAVPITVPYSPSQTALYNKVLGTAGVSAEDISYLEAHGTGTPVGDVQEFESIRKTFGCGVRRRPLHFASVKGSIGHTEGASGVAGLIKVLLMMRKRRIPVQANYTTLNPKISLEPGQLAIPTETIVWEAEGSRLAIVNNYGAAGSMAAMVVKEAPREYTCTRQTTHYSPMQRCPFVVSANSKESLAQNCQKLRQLISSSQHEVQLRDLAFNLSDTQNMALPAIFASTASTMTDLDQQLAQVAANPDSGVSRPTPKSVILVFGGQTAQCASISRETYDSCSIFRRYLDSCHDTLLTLGYRGIYPDIFIPDPIDDVVGLQARQFAVQYASAQAWIACGLRVKCLLGHSFGQLVALAVSGVLSLADGLKLVCRRGSLVRNEWGPEKGSMVALDADIDMTRRLMSVVQERHGYTEIEIACYNGPRSHVLVGSGAEIEAVAAVARESGVRCKVLAMTHGYHSRYCDAITRKLEHVAGELEYHEPKIPVETCSEGASWPAATAKLIAEHTRTAVYFGDAVKRIEEREGTCTWIEAGTNSSVINLTRRVFVNSESRAGEHLFCPVNLVDDGVLRALADITATLWRHGHRVQFWPFHRVQRHDYIPVHLPGYQFERKHHWLDFRQDAAPSSDDREERQPHPEHDPVLITFNGFQDASQKAAVFTIDPRSAEWQTLAHGHSVLGEPLCPAPLYMELVAQASRELASRKGISCSTSLPRFDGLGITKPLGASRDKVITLTLHQSESTPSVFEFVFQSRDRTQSLDSGKQALHATGSVEMISPDGVRHAAAELDRLGRLIGRRELQEPEGGAAQGALIYKIFSRVVDYQDFYKGVRTVASGAGTAVATVRLPKRQPAAVVLMPLNPVAIDNFLQVPGLLSNCFAECPSEEVFVCTLVERVQFSPDVEQLQSGNGWEVLAMSTVTGPKECTNDVFVRDKDTGRLVFIAFGAVFSRVRISSLARVISRANTSKATCSSHLETPGVGSIASGLDRSTAGLQRSIGKLKASTPESNNDESPTDTATRGLPTPATSTADEHQVHSGLDFEMELRELLGRITDIPPHDFRGEVDLEHLGIDSLMATEIASEVNQVYNISIPQEDLLGLSTFSSLRDYLATRGGTCQLSTNSSSSTKATPSQSTITTSDEKGLQYQETSPSGTNLHDAGRDELVDRLASLLATHLECPVSTFHRFTVLADCGLDSLACMELMSDIEKLFGVSVDLSALTMESVFGDLADILVHAVTGAQGVQGVQQETNTYATLSSAADDFEMITGAFDDLAEKHGFSGFYRSVHPGQTQLVLAYIVEAFADLGVDLSRLDTGDEIPGLPVIPKHHHLRDALYQILREGGVVDYDGSRHFRSEKPLEPTSSRQLLKAIIQLHPQHAKEHELLDLVGSQLGELLRGEKDPLSVLFGSKASRTLLEDVYSSSPMYVVMSQLLATFLQSTLRKSSPGTGGKFRIIEVGAGTGSTTGWIVQRLVECGVPVEYTFTDISSSLVAAAKRKFSKMDCILYTTLDIEKEPPTDLQGHFDVVISTNCIHATSNLSRSLANLNKLLQPNGFMALVEFTKRFSWFDIVFGILEGWWLFDDGRRYVLAPPEHWARVASGFAHVSWTGGSTRESEAVRIITGFKKEGVDSNRPLGIPQERTGGTETFVFKHTDRRLPLKADVYYPSPAQEAAHNTWTAGTEPALSRSVLYM